MFPLASIATISICTFLFCLFLALIANAQNVAKTVETTVGAIVFFGEDMPKGQILAVGGGIRDWEEVWEMQRISATQTWENSKTDYFGGVEELAEGFAGDNPLSGPTSHEIFLNNIEGQDKIVERLEGMEGVREVRYSSTAVVRLTSTGKMVEAMSAAIVCALLAVAVFPISNIISVATVLRRRENEIMRLINTTNYMIRTPLAAEGVPLGALGAAVPLTGMYALYQRAIIYISEYCQALTGMFGPTPLGDIFPYTAATTGCLGVGIGFFVSYFIIRCHLKVQERRA